jgi:hypothetical protein
MRAAEIELLAGGIDGRFKWPERALKATELR